MLSAQEGTLCAQGTPPASLTSRPQVLRPDPVLGDESGFQGARGGGRGCVGGAGGEEGGLEAQGGKRAESPAEPPSHPPRSLITSTRRPGRGWCSARAPTGWCTRAATGTRGYASPSRRSQNGTAGVVRGACEPGWDQELRGSRGRGSKGALMPYWSGPSGRALGRESWSPRGPGLQSERPGPGGSGSGPEGPTGWVGRWGKSGRGLWVEQILGAWPGWCWSWLGVSAQIWPVSLPSTCSQVLAAPT